MIILACDHGGFELKEQVKAFFNGENISTIDVGAYSNDPLDDFPDFAKPGCERVAESKQNVGIFICGSGVGMSIACNRHPKIRAALCHNPKIAGLARKHNDANVLVLPGRYINKTKAIAIIKVFLTTDFEKGKYARRMKKV